MGMFERARLWWQQYTGEDETPLDGDTPAWVVSLAIHVGVFLALAAAGLGQLATAPRPVTVIETPVEEPQDVLVVPKEISLNDVLQDEVGAEDSSESMDLAPSIAPELAEESIVPVEDLALTDTVAELDPLDVEAVGKMVDASLTVKGPGGVGTSSAGGAVDRLTLEIAASLEQAPTLVCWVFDQSVSLAGQRKDIAARLDRVFNELGVSRVAKSNEMFNLVFAYGKMVTPVTPTPTQEVSAVVKAIDSIPVDDSGVEMTFTAVAEAAKWSARARLSGPERRNVMIVVFTDEVGNDQQHADVVSTFCRRQGMRVFVVGVPAPFGMKDVKMKFVEFDPQYAADEQWAVVNQGPETLYPEVVRIKFGNEADRAIDSGFGPFSLSKLCAETGGIYFAVHANRGASGRVSRADTAPMASQLEYFFDPQVMRDYRPDYVQQAKIDALLAANKAMRALVEAAKASEMAGMDAPRMEFPREDDGKLALLLSEAQKKAAVLQPKIDGLYGILAAGLPDRPKVGEKRWQAGYDLALGRVLALKVRTDAYNIMLAQAKSGMKFKDPKNDTWLLVPSDDVSAVGSQTEKMAKQADELLRRVVAEHPGTPWAWMAAEELRSPLGYTWEERYTGVNAPRMANAGNGNPNPGDDMRRNLAPPKPKRPLKNL